MEGRLGDIHRHKMVRAAVVGRVGAAGAIGQQVEVLRMVGGVAVPPSGEGVRHVHVHAEGEALPPQPPPLLGDPAAAILGVGPAIGARHGASAITPAGVHERRLPGDLTRDEADLRALRHDLAQRPRPQPAHTKLAIEQVVDREEGADLRAVGVLDPARLAVGVGAEEEEAIGIRADDEAVRRQVLGAEAGLSGSPRGADVHVLALSGRLRLGHGRKLRTGREPHMVRKLVGRELLHRQRLVRKHDRGDRLTVAHEFHGIRGQRRHGDRHDKEAAPHTTHNRSPRMHSVIARRNSPRTPIMPPREGAAGAARKPSMQIA